MFGLVVLLIIFGYLAVAVTATVLTVRSVKRAGGGRRDQWKRGGLVALVFYLIPFWDAIPTWVVFHYKCRTEAVFEVKTDAESWKRKNIDSLDSLRIVKDGNQVARIPNAWRYMLNQRIALEDHDPEAIFLSVKGYRFTLTDVGTKEVLATKRDFSSGSTINSGTFEGLKFWMRKSACHENPEGRIDAFADLLRAYRALAKEEK